MAAYPRAELEEMIRRFVAENNRAGTTGDWSKMSQFYAGDALYTWNVGQNWEFAARGRKEIHDIVFGAEMRGLVLTGVPLLRRGPAGKPALRYRVGRSLHRRGLLSEPRPPPWSVYRVLPISIECVTDRPFRLHDRIEFRPDDIASPWSKTRMDQ